jgi:hypothetical protein
MRSERGSGKTGPRAERRQSLALEKITQFTVVQSLQLEYGSGVAGTVKPRHKDAAYLH